MMSLGKCLLGAALILGWCTAVAQAQDKDEKRREAQLRTVRGDVVDKDENAVPNGVVYLKNLKTLTVKTHIADKDGRFHFSGLDPNVDYEVHAESETMISNKRTISSFDSRKEIVVHLKLDRKKEQK